MFRALLEKEGEVTPVGARKPRRVDVRIVAATHRNLSQAVADGAFREDLYYRLNVLNRTVPPLRMRREDIPQLAQHFLIRCSASLRKSVLGLSPTALEMLLAYPWPGNVRELENCIERAVHMATADQIEPADLPLEMLHKPRRSVTTPDDGPVAFDLGAHERNAIIGALRETGGNVRIAAKMLKVSRGGLYIKMTRLGIDAQAFR